MKKTLLILIPIILLITLLIVISNSQNGKYKESEAVYIEQINNKENVVTVSDPLHYMDMLSGLSSDSNLTVSSIAKTDADESSSADTTSSESNSESNNDPSTNIPSILLDPNITYRVVSIEFNASSDKQEYRPILKVYCQTNENSEDNSWSVDHIIATTINTYTKDISMTFEGTLYANLEDANTIYWSVNGDFFEKGAFDPNNIQLSFTDQDTATISLDADAKHFSYSCIEGRITVE